VGTLKGTLKEVLAGYTKKGLNGYSYLAVDPEERLFTSVVVGWLDGKQFAFADLIVQLVGDKIIINQDANDNL